MPINNILSGKNNILIKLTYRCLCLFIFGGLYWPALQATESTDPSEIIIRYEKDDLELTASCFITSSRELVVFLPSVYAPFEDQLVLASEIAAQGLSTCFSHVFTDLFLPVENKSYKEIPVDGVLALLQNIRQKRDQSIFLVSHGTGAKLAYTIARLSLQNDIEATQGLTGLILFSPNLLAVTPAPGENQQYISLIDHQTLPLFIIQPTYSPHHWHLDNLIEQIKKSGTRVHHKRLADIRDGYALREYPSKEEQTQRQQMPALLWHAIRQLTDDE